MIFFAGGIGIGIGAGFYGIVIFSVLISLALARISQRFEDNQHKRLENSEKTNSIKQQEVG